MKSVVAILDQSCFSFRLHREPDARQHYYFLGEACGVSLSVILI